MGRHAPEPGSHRRRVSSQIPQHGFPPPDVQSSAVGRQTATGSRMHLFPLLGSHRPEQQSASFEQSDPSRKHSEPPHMPALQANEQQSLARAHAAPTGRHPARHAREAVPNTGSHSPLQQSARVEHAMPAPAHGPGIEQTLDAQCPEQQSDEVPQGSPSARHA